MPSLVRNGFDFQYVPQSTCDFGAQLMELITRALAGVIAAWIPIEGAQDRKHVAKAQKSVFTTARSAPKIILLDKKRLEWRKARATLR
jgi:hypothetical protein